MLAKGGKDAVDAVDAAISSAATPAPGAPPSVVPPLAPKAAGPGKEIKYEVVSDGKLMSLTYFGEKSEMVQVGETPAPWSLTLRNSSTAVIAGVTAQTKGTSVTCRVMIDGKVKEEKTSTGQYAVVNCSGIGF